MVKKKDNTSNCDNGTARCNNNNVHHPAGLFFLSTVMAKKTNNTSKIDDTNFVFYHCNIMQCDYEDNTSTIDDTTFGFDH